MCGAYQGLRGFSLNISTRRRSPHSEKAKHRHYTPSYISFIFPLLQITSDLSPSCKAVSVETVNCMESTFAHVISDVAYNRFGAVNIVASCSEVGKSLKKEKKTIVIVSSNGVSSLHEHPTHAPLMLLNTEHLRKCKPQLLK